MQRAISAVLLASAIPLSAFENLDFEQTPPPADTWTEDVPGWQHIGAIGGAGNYWNVNFANLSGWAEATLLHLDGPVFPGGPWPAPPMDGRVSIAFSAFWPLLPNQPTTNDYGSAWIAQTGSIEPDAPWLKLVTDYTGPHTSYYPENPDYFAVGHLTIYFDRTPVPFGLVDAGTGALGQPLRELRADLSPFAGQTGELRIGIEGPHTFVIDDIQFVPEPSPLALVVAGLGIICLHSRLRSRGHSLNRAQA